MNNSQQPAAAQAANADSMPTEAPIAGVLNEPPYPRPRLSTIITGTRNSLSNHDQRTITAGSSKQDPIAVEDELCTHLPHSPTDNTSLIDPASSTTFTTSSSFVRVPENAVRSIPSPPSATRINRKRRKFKEEVNWCDRRNLLKNLKLFDVEQRELIENAKQKQDDFSDGFNAQYFANVYAIIASGFEHATTIAKCGYVAKGGKKRPCRKWMFCSKCAWFNGLVSTAMFGGSFNKSTFYHLTCSFDGSVRFGVDPAPDLRIYWLAVERAIREALSSGMIDGAVVVHELSIRQFLPLRVVPHSHVLLCGDSFDADDQEDVAGFIRSAKGVVLEPSLDCKRLHKESYFKRILFYQCKAIDLLKPYRNALDIHGTGRLVDLNLEVKNFISDASAAILQFPRIKRMGKLKPSAKGFIGDSKWASKIGKQAEYKDTRVVVER